MDRAPAYHAVFSEGATDSIVSLSKRRQRKIRSLIAALVASPTLPSDYWIPDEHGRRIDHLMAEFLYWIDHAAREVRIVGIEIVD